MSISLRRTISVAGLAAVAFSVSSAQAPRVNKYGYPEKLAPRPTSAAISEDDLMTRLYIFADDSMQGRQYGRVGNMRGTNYIAREVRRLGLMPAGDSGTYFQRLPMVQQRFTDQSTITVDGQTLRFNTDFVPVPPGGRQRAPRPIQGAQVAFGGTLGDTATMIDPSQAEGKVLIFFPGQTGGRGANTASSVTVNPCAVILNPGLSSGGAGGRAGFPGGGGAINLAARYPTAAAFVTADLDATPIGRRAFINDPIAIGTDRPPPSPRAPVVYTRNGVIAAVTNGQVSGGALPSGMTPTQLQQMVDSMRADSIARMRRQVVARQLDTVRACAVADSIAVSHGAASMMGSGGLAAAEAAVLSPPVGGRGGGGGGGGGGRGRGGAGGASGEPPIANLRVTRAAAERLLGAPTASLRPGAAGKTISANLVWDERDASDWARNVVAVIPGSDPALRGQYVLLSAHNDHVGFNTNPVDHDSLKAYNEIRTRIALSKRVGDLAGGPDIAADLAAIRINVDSLRRIRPARLDSINNGADDDGSGSMAILEIAEYIARMPVKPKRSTIFVWQTGEEAGGLQGSTYFAAHPTVPIDSIVANINLDMIGRGRAEDIPGGGPTYVAVVGSGFLSSDLANVVAATNLKQKQPLALDPKFDLFTTWPGYNSIYTRSDHYSYARQCIPIAFFFTGLHGDYHQRTDEAQYIDYPHYNLITNYIRDVVVELGTRPQRPSLNKPCLR